ncbi:MAG TPA: polymer-forming cytoskeletal protein [candidate division WOR-3 bacterium]|uniref:Polymer-forming cytoskeletal protein n=1 Tax=candidate division WOR-3 bacterium TaxID=2052148 RepID=A0A7V0T525_UNCW3|nr:polymer-forming cytoskeletal protein [candidate division WOR-3 bacterium]
MRRIPVLFLLAVSLAFAARFEAGSSFTLGPEELQFGDLYFGGSALRVDGAVDGSVAAGCQTAAVTGRVTRNLFVAAQSITVDGPVGGDIIAAGQHLSVGDSVAGAVRAMAATVHVSGRVGRDLVAAASGITITRDAEVAGDLVCGTTTLTIDGTVRGDVRAAAREIIISGTVDGDVICAVDERIILTENARVFGSLRYSAEKELDIGNRDAVFGSTEFTRRARGELDDVKPFRPRPDLLRVVILPFALLSVLGALAVAFLLVAIWKRALSRALDSARERFGRTVGAGAIALFAAPAAVVVALALVVTFPVGFIGGTLWLVGLYLAKIVAGVFLGRWLFGVFGGRGASLWLTTPIGVVLVYALCAVPVIGWLFWVFAALVGFGVMVELIGQSRRV